MTARLLIAAILGATLIIPLGFIVPWAVTPLPDPAISAAFLDFDYHQNLIVMGWVVLSFLFFVVPSKFRWLCLFVALATISIFIPVWATIFHRDQLMSEISDGGGVLVSLMLTGLVFSIASAYGIWRSALTVFVGRWS